MSTRAVRVTVDPTGGFVGVANAVRLVAGVGSPRIILAAMAVGTHAVCRFLADDVEAARGALQGSNIPFAEEEVVNVLLENRAGEVAMVAHKLAEAGVNLHAIYVLGVESDLIELAIAVDRCSGVVR